MTCKFLKGSETKGGEKNTFHFKKMLMILLN